MKNDKGFHLNQPSFQALADSTAGAEKIVWNDFSRKPRRGEAYGNVE